MSAPDTAAAIPVPSGAREAAMPFILITVLIDMVSIGLIVPVLPALVGTFTANPAEQAFWYGAVAFAFGIANFFGAPILGGLSDRYGRRPVLLIGFCGLALNFFATALATALWMLIAVRLVGGAMQANAAVANAYVADITAPEKRAKRFGQLGAMFGLGFILGPVVGGILGGIDLHLPFFAAGTLALLNLLYGWFVLPESLPAERRRPMSWAAANPINSLRALTRLKGVGLLVAVIACTGLAQFTMYTSWVLYTGLRFGWGPAENGWSLFAVGIMSALVQGLLLGRLLKRFSPQRLALAGLVSSTIAFALWGMATQGWMMYAVIFANLLGFTVTASIQSIISGAAAATEQGKTMGSVSALNSLMAVIAPVLGAPLIGVVSHLPANDWRVGAPFYFCALLQGMALLLAWTHFRGVRRARLAAAGRTAA
ncbi:DHA1 family tetracycline resistance protein-like MFS transporter [Rivibacter subsaxonicus]|uniref:DHA1 family tetracycline resistance protein-like MFS transporter n=2 Tax=Rivibacter subsaxonicus TaxID=457575 RepID=A0A4Q7VP71_9BURK|nr:MFS transporter [Rivibacter subsaxonicus]RZT98216.1 DHA1 family tetracycline resistance protein-like MFS transporter [Rivibacter subsaxonicus]